MSNLKKGLIFSLTVTLVFWSVGLAALVPMASASITLSAGDLITSPETTSVYYYAADGNRYTFPNANTYYTWYEDFSGVVEIEHSDLQAIHMAGTLTYRPGTRLVKITTDTKVYAVGTDAKLHWIDSEGVALELYGENWAGMVDDVADVFIDDYTNYGSGDAMGVDTLSSGSNYPSGTLVNDGTNTYYIDGSTKRMVTDEGMSGNRFMSKYAVAVSSLSGYTDGDNVTAYESALADPVVGGNVEEVTGDLEVSLSSSTPKATSVPKNATNVTFVAVDLTASSEDVTLDGLVFHRADTGATGDFSNVYLYDGATRLTSGRSVSSLTHEVEFNNLDLEIEAGKTKTLTVKADLSTPSTTGGLHYFELVSASSVSANATVSGDFPVQGYSMTVSSQSGSTATVTSGATPSNPTVGEKDAKISSFKIQAGSNDLDVNRLTIFQVGTVSNTDLSNFVLKQGGSTLAETASMNGDKIIFDLSDDPFVITNGSTKTFDVHADIAGRSTRTIKTYFEYTTDVEVTDSVYGFGAAVDIGATSGSFNGSGSNYIEVTTQGGQVTVAVNGPTTGDIAKGTQNAVLLEFSLTAADQDVEMRQIDLTIASTAGGLVRGSDPGNNYFTAIRIVDTADGKTLMGPKEHTAIASAITTGEMNFTDTFTISAGETKNLEVQVNLRNSEDQTVDGYFDEGYAVTLGDFGSTYVYEPNTGDYVGISNIVPNSNITGNTQTVKASSLTISLASTPVSDTVVKKSKNVPAAGFLFQAGTDSDVTVRTITLTGMGDVDGTTYVVGELDDVVTAIRLYDGDTQVGTDKSPSALGKASFSNFEWVIPAGTSKKLIAKVDLASSIGTSTNDVAYLGIAAVADVTSEDADNNEITAAFGTTSPANSTPTVALTVANAGTLTIAADTGTNPSSKQVTMGQTDVVYQAIKLSATNEDIKITRLQFERTTGTLGADADFEKVKLSDGTNVYEGYLNTNLVRFDIPDESAIVVPKDGNIVLTLKADMNTYSGGAITGDDNIFGLDYNYTSSPFDSNYASNYAAKAVGADSGTDVFVSAAANLNGNAMYVYATKLNVSLYSGSPSGSVAAGQDRAYMYLLLSNTDTVNNKDAEVTSLAVTITDTLTAAPDNFLLYDNADPSTTVEGSYVGNSTNTGGVVTFDTSAFAYRSIGEGSSNQRVWILTGDIEADTSTSTVETLQGDISLGTSASAGQVSWKDGVISTAATWVETGAANIAGGLLKFE